MDLDLIYYHKGSNKLNSLLFKNITDQEACKEIDKFFENKEKLSIIEAYDMNKKQAIYMQFSPENDMYGKTSVAIVMKIGFLGFFKFGGVHTKYVINETLSSFKNRLKEINIKNIEYLYNKYKGLKWEYYCLYW